MSLPNAVLFLCDYQAPYGGSFIPSLTALEKALTERGARVCWALPAGAEKRSWCRALASEGRTVAFLPEGKLARFMALDRLVKTQRIELVHAHFGWFTPARLLALLHPRLRVLLHVHSDFSGGAQPSRLKKLAKTLVGGVAARRVTRVMVGAHMAEREKNAVYIPNGVDFSRAAADTESRAALRARLGIAESDTLVLMFGWTPYIKGLDVAARAVDELRGRGFVLGVVTGRDMTADKLSGWLLSHDCDTAAVRFLPPAENVFCYHRAADIMLSASRSETFSYALAEALYAGRPCVMSDIPGTRWASRYDTVLVFPAGDSAALTEALIKAAEGFSPEALASSRESVRKDCDIARWADGMLALYEGSR